MANNRYVGARYVPIVVGSWDNGSTYEALSVVMYQGDSYISKIPVPAGIDITNTGYWVKCANYNAQWAAYQETVYKKSDFLVLEGTTTSVNAGENKLENITLPAGVDGRQYIVIGAMQTLYNNSWSIYQHASVTQGMEYPQITQLTETTIGVRVFNEGTDARTIKYRVVLFKPGFTN